MAKKLKAEKAPWFPWHDVDSDYPDAHTMHMRCLPPIGDGREDGEKPKHCTYAVGGAVLIVPAEWELESSTMNGTDPWVVFHLMFRVKDGGTRIFTMGGRFSP